jgi:uncharacterized protein YndB with AHSA1/START domain
MAETAADIAIRKSVDVAASVEDAFRVFTERAGSWWPLTTKSVGQEDAVDLVFEPGVDGRVYERLRSGDEHDWGGILAWEPPHRLVFTWHPGRDPETSQEVEVRFSPTDEGARIELEHRGWERVVATADEFPEHYDSGWDEVLGRFAEAAHRG